MIRLSSLIVAFALSSAIAQGQAPRIEVGQPFPGLTLPRMNDGQPASISDFRGHKLALHIWASW